MSLLERVKRAGNAPASSEREESTGALTLLRNQVQSVLSIDQIALLSQSNPERARNEVRSACRHAFESEDWQLTGEKERADLVAALLNVIFGFGVLEDLLADPTITEIMVNGPESVFVERDGIIEATDRCFADEAELRALIDRILGPLGRRIDEASPMVNARLPQGHRVNVVIPPISLNGPTMTIRKFTRRVMTLEEMTANGSLDPALCQFLIWAVRSRKSIAVSGGTGSGKTTLLNALSCVIPYEERIITIEDSAELRFLNHPHVISLEARPRNAEGVGAVTIRDLVINALRMRPDRIVVGECRGAEALDMLQAMSTGHDGSLTTLHANSPEESVSRLATMVRYGADLPIDVIEANIANAIDLVVQTQRNMTGERLVTEVVELFYDLDKGRCKARSLYQRRSDASKGVWTYGPTWMNTLERNGWACREEVEAWLQACLQAA